MATSASGGKKMKLSRDQIVGALIVILGVFVFVMISWLTRDRKPCPDWLPSASLSAARASLLRG